MSWVGWGIWETVNGEQKLTTECIENVIMMVPFSAVVMWTFGEKIGNGWKKILWYSGKIAFIFSISIEMLQLLLRLGTFQLSDMNSNFRRNRMSNARIQQLVTLFYMHRTMVESDGIKKSESEEIQKVMKRIDRNYDYYSTNPMIKGTFDFLKMVVDNWFKTV